MFVHALAQDAYLKLGDANEMFALTEASRSHLRRWLPWVDRTRTVADSEAFIGSTLEQFAKWSDPGLVDRLGAWLRSA